MKHAILMTALLSIQPLVAKDFVLNFEKSCYQYYGEETKERIIQTSIDNWNDIEGTPRIFIRGKDIDLEIDETNYSNYIWSPFTSPITGLFGNHTNKELNPIICDEDGAIQDDQNWFDFGYQVHGWANVPKPNFNFFAVYINESHGITDVGVVDWETTVAIDTIIPDGRMTEEQAISLLTHELGHIIGLKHTPKEEPENDYPIMWSNNINHTGCLQLEDFTEHERAIPWEYNGSHGDFTFESKIERESERSKITVRINTPFHLIGINSELLVAAQLDGEDKWYMLTNDGWEVWIDELKGSNVNTYFANDKIIFDDVWINKRVTVYFGFRINDEIYYNLDMPLILEEILGK